MADNTSNADDVDGWWQGVIQFDARSVCVEVEIVAMTEGTGSGAGSHSDGDDGGAKDSPVSKIQLTEIGLVEQLVRQQRTEPDDIELVADVVTLIAALKDGALVGHISTAFTPKMPVTLVRQHPEVARLRVPRLDGNGRQVHRWTCAPPQELDDGWSTARPGSVGISEDGITSAVEGILAGKEGAIRSFLVARRGQLVVDEYFHRAARDWPHTIQSITKSVTSLILGRVLEEEKIPLDTPVCEFFADDPELSSRRWVQERYDITLRHALTMSANLEWDEELPYTDPRNSNTAMNASPSWLGYVLDRPLVGPPGEAAEYTSGLTLLIGGIIQRITGRYVDEIAADGLFANLGITDFSWSHHKDGTRHTGGGLGLRARDLAKLGQLVVDHGVWQGKQVVPASWIDDATRRQLPLKGALDAKEGYGYQWWILDFEHNGEPLPCSAGLGYGGQVLCVFPTLELVIVMNAIEWIPVPDYDWVRLAKGIVEAVEM